MAKDKETIESLKNRVIELESMVAELKTEGIIIAEQDEREIKRLQVCMNRVQDLVERMDVPADDRGAILGALQGQMWASSGLSRPNIFRRIINLIKGK